MCQGLAQVPTVDPKVILLPPFLIKQMQGIPPNEHGVGYQWHIVSYKELLHSFLPGNESSLAECTDSILCPPLSWHELHTA